MAADLDRIDELLADQEASIQRAFRQFIADMNSEAVTSAIQAKLENNDFEGAFAIVESYIGRFSAVIPAIAATVGAYTAAELADVVADSIPDNVYAVSFNTSFPRAAQIVEAHRTELADYFIQQQRASTSNAVARAMREATIVTDTLAGSYTEGTHLRSAARAFRDSIGLTAEQDQWVANYRQSLETRSKAALQRDLRNRRFDGAVERSIARGKPLTPNQIDRMVDAYRKNALQYRAETIAREEGGRATAEARDEARDQMIDQTGIEPDRVEEMWNATRDTRTRSFHASMNGQKRAIGVPFTDGLGNALRYPHDPKAPLKTRIGCRCTKTFSIRPAEAA